MTDRVLLLHGLFRSAACMAPMARAMQDAGFRTLNPDYPSRHATVEELARQVAHQARAFLAGPAGGAARGRVHLVGHSLGGLVARALIAHARPAALGRVVMLGPPNGGSELADLLHQAAPARHLFGPVLAQLRTRHPAPADPVDYDLGIIAGDRALDPLGYALLPRPNDGRVPVARTHLAGMADHRVLHVTHALMMRDAGVIRQTIHFLRHGRFG